MPPDSDETLELHLVRHAHAGWPRPGVSDFERPLDERGRFEARDVAEQALMAGVRPSLLVSSPARRCRETAEAFLAVFRNIRLIEDEQLYSGGSDSYLVHIAGLGESRGVMIVGHNPMIEALAHHLVRESEVMAPVAMGYPTAGLLSIAFPAPMPHKLLYAGRATQLITPSLT